MINKDDRRESRWQAFQKRLVQKAQQVLANNRNDGVAILTAYVLVDGTGTPLFWVIPGGRRIEPSRDAQKVVAELLWRLGAASDVDSVDVEGEG